MPSDQIDQPTLRDRIRRAICEASGFTWLPDGLMEPDEYGDHADAVLAVLPAPVDRAGESDRLRTENSRMRHELEVMYGGAFDTHRLALSQAIGLGTGAPWDAIQERASELHLASVDGIDWKAKYEAEHARHVEVVRSLIADPAAVLRGAADDWTARCPDHSDAEEAFMDCPCDWAAELRRLADEAQQPACGNCGHPAAWHDPWEGCVGPDGIGSAGSGDCTCTRSPDEAQQPEEAGR